MRRTIVLFLVGVAICRAYPAGQEDDQQQQPQQPSAIEDGIETAYKWVQGCGDKDMFLCLKMRALTYVDKVLRRPEDITLMEGISLVRTEAASRELNGRGISEAELDASLPKNAEDKDAQVESMLVDRVARFLQTHTLQLKVPDSSIEEVRKSLDEARGKKKKLKMLLPLLLMLKLKAAALIPLALGALALLALKALIVGKLALVLSGLIGLQKLLASKHHTQSYEVVAHPHYTEEHGHYGRSVDDAQQVAYRAYAPKQE
uniref:Osiris 9 n=1 Tax=Triatoma infestans TaxID=30076 RepID=A0A161MHB5_TRIIF